MVIPFNKKQNNLFLYLGFIYTLLGVLFIITNSGKGIASLLFLIMGILPILFYFQSKKGYIKIEEGTLSVNQLFRWKRINLNELSGFKKFAGDYIFKNNDREVTIELNGMATENIERLDSELVKYGLTLN